MGLSDLPLASGRAHQKVFQALGWELRNNGVHLVLTHVNHFGVTLSIPNHKEVRRGTLQAIIRNSGLTDKQYRNFFDSL